MADEGGGASRKGGERFPARRRCRLPEELGASPLSSDPVLEAVRRLRTGRPPLPPADALRETLAGQLHRLDSRLRRLRAVLPAQGAGAPADGLPAGADDPVLRGLLEHARAYFDEWRLLLLEERQPGVELADFAASPYMDLLQRHYPRLALLLDGEGRLLRLLHGERCPPAPGGPPAPGQLLTLHESPAGLSLGDAWPGLPPLHALPLGEGRLLVLAEEGGAGPPAPGPGANPRPR